jgi:hypothetical protein
MESQLIQVINLKMQMIPFVSIVNLIQRKLMKVISNMTNMRKRISTRHGSGLIEAMNLKMFLIRFHIGNPSAITLCKSLPAPPSMINSVIGIRELHTAGFDDRGASLMVRFTVGGIGRSEK